MFKFLDAVLDPANQPVFIHCAHGCDRTGVMAAVYRMEVEGWAPGEALEEMRAFGCSEVYGDLIRYVERYRRTGLYRDRMALTCAGRTTPGRSASSEATENAALALGVRTTAATGPPFGIAARPTTASIVRSTAETGPPQNERAPDARREPPRRREFRSDVPPQSRHENRRS